MIGPARNEGLEVGICGVRQPLTLEGLCSAASILKSHMYSPEQGRIVASMKILLTLILCVGW